MEDDLFEQIIFSVVKVKIKINNVKNIFNFLSTNVGIMVNCPEISLKKCSESGNRFKMS